MARFSSSSTSTSTSTSTSARTLTAPVVSGGDRGFVTFEEVCGLIANLDSFLDSIPTTLFIESGIVDPETMKFKDGVPGWKVQITKIAIQTKVSEEFNRMYNSESGKGSLEVPYSGGVKVSVQEAAAIQSGMWGSRRYGVKSIFYSNYFVQEAKARHRAFLEAQGKGEDWQIYKKEQASQGKEVTVKIPIQNPKETQAKA